MHIKEKQKVINIILPSINGNEFNLQELKGIPYMISFFRFATCPFCNMRINQLITRYNEFGKDFTIIAIFDSSLENLQKHNKEDRAPFPILADGKNVFYKKYGIKKSFLGMLKGMFFRFPTLIKGMLKGYFPIPPKGSMITMPAQFLIDKNGVIQKVYYGKDEGDHLDFETIKSFSLQ